MKHTPKILFLLVLYLFISYSCSLKSEYIKTASCDARIITLVTADDTLFGLGLYAFTTGQFYSVSAYLSGSDSGYYELQPFYESTNDYFYETPLSEMSETPPESGNYIFDIEFEDSEFGTSDDYLSDDYIMPPFLTTCEYNTDIDRIVISWAEIVNNYVLKFEIYNQNRELLFSSSTVDKTTVIYTIGYNEQTWAGEETPANGDSLILRVLMYSFEPLSNSPYDTQSVAILEKNIVWGG
ncbi:MAG: hypothetical protein JXR31_04930 [Prolixibacteraceae bacterium]|nr:hypothetical protein [Prolixibacteraceae bacterium]MBN2773570.1 hypothetical protein [Prolixibacteraceae bacterium]